MPRPSERAVPEPPASAANASAAGTGGVRRDNEAVVAGADEIEGTPDAVGHDDGQTEVERLGDDEPERLLFSREQREHVRRRVRAGDLRAVEKAGENDVGNGLASDEVPHLCLERSRPDDQQHTRNSLARTPEGLEQQQRLLLGDQP